MIVAPPRAYGGGFERCWLLAVQLYGVRSARNWGIGDFTDLKELIELAGHLGADGVGLNPLHALFDDRPGGCSPYSPNSRLFLNALYIDVGTLPGGTPADTGSIDRLRAGDIVDYAAVTRQKWRALRAAFKTFRAEPAAGRRRDFAKFRAERGAATGAVRLLRGAATQIQQAVVGMAGTLAATSEVAAPRCARAPTPPRSSSSNSCNGSPTGNCGIAGISPQARPEGRPLSRRRRGRAIRRFRCLERAGRDLAPSRCRRATGSAQYRRPELGPRGLQRRRS